MAILFHPTKEDITLPTVLYGLGDPIRLCIAQRIAGVEELTCGQAFPEPVAKSTLSHHIRILREAGIIFVRKRGREYYSSLRREDLNFLFPGLLEVILGAPKAAEEKAAD